MKYLAAQDIDNVCQTKNSNLSQVNPVKSVTFMFGHYTHRTRVLVGLQCVFHVFRRSRYWNKVILCVLPYE